MGGLKPVFATCGFFGVYREDWISALQRSEVLYGSHHVFCGIACDRCVFVARVKLDVQLVEGTRWGGDRCRWHCS